jgi:hypothetical protein
MTDPRMRFWMLGAAEEGLQSHVPAMGLVVGGAEGR